MKPPPSPVPKPLGLGAIMLAVLRREIALAMRQKGEVLTPLVFFIVIASLFPLGVGPESALLLRMAPGVLWVSALLAAMLSLQRMFASDYADGSLEQMLLSSTPLALLVAAKALSHFLLSGLPLVLVAPVLGLQFGLDGPALGILMLSLLLGTPTLSLIGSIGASLTLGVRGAGVLLSLLILPLYIPVLIFGAGAVEAYASGLGPGGHLSLLAALLVLALFFAPLATTAALKISLE
ncbi:MAG: heme exporter protein CcmB [Alicycliphilus sp.]|jgi:heme exporter protein B|uniref:Heme exporter protein B n=1 Tax=Diaphorobacter limosus TaxID=3036128 RepID=A0ABZ0J6C2_9BURK|nr:heme exporter protein CcmB [Diaphorobacter sp. Y-1]MBP6751585.1 heme exporter protein CcmB [Alicycliphilus sp.]MBP7324936.1 heme exporter protein CcmB [Alicycliphilus sp.]MBP7328306.1 heme exporter protein CcmB [Alicycliphilus sp.]TXJ14038.1 MAG: heme exporter protein CcmB [Alicycliphilus sp.]WOO33628.1 heme exporter protein CcmB [Diaphorobacter sp. Y-1]